VLACLIAVLATAAPEPPRTDEEPGHPTFGHVVSGVGDLDGDGTPDILLADAGSAGHRLTGRPVRTCVVGRVWAVSGRTAETLHVVAAAEPDDGFGAAVRPAGDVDLDGRPDWIAGTIDRREGEPGYALVVSGRTGLVLHRFCGEAAGDLFGWSVDGAGDVDGDGHADVLIGARDVGSAGSTHGVAYVFSGSDGRLLHRIVGTPPGAWGCLVRGAGDVDGDGRCDVLVADAWEVSGLPRVELRIHSGADGSVLGLLRRFPEWDGCRPSLATGVDADGDGAPDVALAGCGTSEVATLPGGRTLTELGSTRDAFASLGDLDGDGWDEILTGDDMDRVNTGRVDVRSSWDGRVLYSIAGDSVVEDPFEIWHFGAAADAVGDVDGDGACDFVVGADFLPTGKPGRAWLFSGREGRLLRTFARAGDSLLVEAGRAGRERARRAESDG
jgi:FG-GAP-like repeat